MSKRNTNPAFKINFTDPETAIELVEQETGEPEDGVAFTSNRLLFICRGRGIRLTLGSSRDTGALALALLSMSTVMAATEGLASSAVQDAFATREAAGNA